MRLAWSAAGAMLLLVCAPACPQSTAPPAGLSELAAPAAQQYCLRLARRAFDTFVRSRTVIDPPSPIPPFLRGRSGVFVSTMDSRDAPRTCMGTLYPVQADLAEEIIANAVASAGRDRRFPPVRKSELSHLDLIVSIVGTPLPISKAQAAALDPSVQGLAAKCGDRFGVVLSGETASRANMLRWARIRAGAHPGEPLQYFEVDDLRFMERPPK